MDSPKKVAQHVRAAKPPGLQLDQPLLRKLKEQALAKARRLQEQASRSTADDLANAKVAAQDIAASRNAKEAGAKFLTLWKTAERAPVVIALARLLICMCFMNLVLEDYQHWAYYQTSDLRERRRIFPHRFPPVHFPWLGVLLFLPCAVLAAVGVQVPITATIMTLDMVWKDISLVWHQLVLLVHFGHRPNELVVKKLAMLGCVAMVLAHSVRERPEQLRINAYAGMLLSGQRSKGGPGIRRSLALLIGRLLICLLFLFVGWTQVTRVMQRDWALWSKQDANNLWKKDGHDNNWLLLECGLALPFAVGWRTRAVSRLLGLVLVLEAVTCWPVWEQWPSWQYAGHVRVHFLTNLAVAGGLVLLQSSGAGRYTVDQLMRKKGT